MAQSVYNRDLYPERKIFKWDKEKSHILFKQDDIWKAVNPKTGKEFIPALRLEGAKSGWAEAPLNHAGFQSFTQGNGLYITNVQGEKIAIATDENKAIIYGQTVSRNEFGIDGGQFWSNDGKKLAFFKKDERAVTDFPLLDINSRTGTLMQIKYPMAGMDSEIIELGVYNTDTKSTTYLKINDFSKERYLTNITWSPDDKHIFVQVLNREQNHVRLNMYSASTGEFVKTILEEKSDKYVEPLDKIYFLKGSNEDFIYRTNSRDGYRNLYLCSTDGEIERLTVVDADVKYVDNDGKYVYYTSAEVSPIENHFFKLNIKSKKATRLTKEEGWHNVSLSPDYKWFISYYSNINTPLTVQYAPTSGKDAKVLYEAKDPTDGYAFTEVSLGKVKSGDGKYDNYYRLIKPINFDPTKKYPVIVYVYGGPHSQMVKNTWLGEIRLWEMYMAQKGYLVYVQDNRGTENRGIEFEQAMHGQCGQVEMEDQMKGVEMLMELPYVDKERIGVHGWSYGGFMTISLITNHPDIFKVAVAGGPVIDWKWYEVMYGERYMGNPTTNPDGYAKVSLISKAKELKGKLLICQGAVDDVVLWQNSLSFIRECVKEGVQVDYFPYPCAKHNVLGKDRTHLMDKVTIYFEDYL